MLDNKFIKKLQCTSCNSELIYRKANLLICQSCNLEYSSINDIPKFLKNDITDQDWNEWKTEAILKTGQSYKARAKGDIPEKEASKSYCNLMKKHNLYEKGDAILDIGSACGHFYFSFHNRLDKNINYTGIDITYEYLKWGKEIFKDHPNVNFVQCDALNLPFKQNSYDIVIVNLFHFFPNLSNVMSEALRVAKKRVIWRTLIGKYNYSIKMISDNNFDKIGTIMPNRDDYNHTLMMIYTRKYLEGLIENLNAKIDFIEQDRDFADFDNNSMAEFSMTATKSINGIQTHGNIMLDWHYLNLVPR